MSTIDMKASVLKGVMAVFEGFDIEFGPVKDYKNYDVLCEFSGCERVCDYYINSPVYDTRYNTVSLYSCGNHVGQMTLRVASEFVEKQLDSQYCKVCEARGFTCNCDSLDSTIGERKVQHCYICGGEGEHDWEVHVAEMKANEQNA